MTEIPQLQERLIEATRTWAAGRDINKQRMREIRQQALLLNHAHYLENIPVYRRLAEEGGYGENVDIETIENNLMLDTDIFKSYRQSWLDSGDYADMTKWLSGLFHRRIEADMSVVRTIDGWIERLAGAGMHVVYSSGTSGAFSFVPREMQDWHLSRTANISCLAPLLACRLSGALPGLIMRSALRMGPGAFIRLSGIKGLRDFDAAFLGFRHGRMGNQVLMEELAPLFRRHYFLYNMTITGSALRCASRGAFRDEERQLLAELQLEVIDKKESNYLKLIDAICKSTKEGQKVFIFGAPYQFKELCEVIDAHNRRPHLKKGSFVFFGGGWKSFTGEVIDREALVGMLSNTLGVPQNMVLEGYSMTEINMLMLRCDYGRFHIPPAIEPVVFDEQLNPIQGQDIKGAFGFLDPLAVSYPGFIISSDYVHMIDGDCECGLCGPAITEIGRMPGSEIKGCGGIMGSMKA